mgnify:CR=1 FL=1
MQNGINPIFVANELGADRYFREGDKSMRCYEVM